jgi:hypothetical protein
MYFFSNFTKAQQFPNEEPATTLQTSNPYDGLHKDFNNSRLFKRLKEKHQPKPYWKSNRKMYLAVLSTSYLFNILSALTAAALVFMFVMGLTNSATISAVITAAALLSLEYMKRETAGKLFHGALQFKSAPSGLIATVVLLSGISTTASYFGAEATVMQFTRPVQLTDMSDQIAPLEGQIKEIDDQIKSAAQTTWQGKMTPRAQRTVDRLSASKAALTDELVRVRQRTDEINDEATYEHEETTAMNASAFAFFTAFSELALLLCLFYCQYYDFRSFAEYAHVSARDAAKEASGRASNGFRRMNGEGRNHYEESLDMANQMRQMRQEVSERPQIGFRYGTHVESSVTNENRSLVPDIQQGKSANALRKCACCQDEYVYGHSRQVYCSDVCRITAWKNKRDAREQRTQTV